MDPTDFEYQMELGGKPCTLLFDIDTFLAFEKKINQSHMNWLMSLIGGSVSLAREMYRDAESAGVAPDQVQVPAGRLMSIADFIAIVWAANHSRATEFRDAKWPMKIEEVKRSITIGTYMEHAPKLIQLILASVQPSAKVKPAETEEQRPTNLSPTPIRSVGGSESGPSDDDVLASLETR